MFDYQHYKPFLRAYADLALKKTKGGFICPFCGSGSGSNGTPAFRITADSTHFQCFSAKCGQQGDIFDLIKVVERISEPQKLQKRVESLFGRTSPLQNGINTAKSAEKKKKEQSNLASEAAEAQKTIAEAAKNRASSNYLENRGISLSTQTRFNTGFCPAWRSPKTPQAPLTERVIIPTGSASYIAVSTKPRNRMTSAEKQFCKQKAGKMCLLGAKNLYDADKQCVFVVEGEIDALSIAEVGFYALGLGGTSGVSLFLEAVKCEKPRCQIIIALDNDAAGQIAAEKLCKALDEQKLSYYLPQTSIYGELKDANDCLCADRAAFTKKLKETCEECKKAAEARLQAEKAAAEQRAAAYKAPYTLATAVKNYLEYVNKLSNSRVPTGFAQFDEALGGGLYPGLYIIGALSSLGKTTFCLQIADQIAQFTQREVLFFSLEQSRFELVAKSISRQTYLHDCTNARTVRQIGDIDFYQNADCSNIFAAMQKINEGFGRKVAIIEEVSSTETAAVSFFAIKKIIEKYIAETGIVPVIMIDYLQMISDPALHLTDKQNIDNTVLSLKRLSRQYNTSVIAISSLNRTSYNSPIGFESFKESGAIEYSADVLLGLQFKGAGDKSFDLAAAKAALPRDIELKILKNRNGASGQTIAFNFFAQYNFFEEQTSADAPQYGESNNSEFELPVLSGSEAQIKSANRIRAEVLRKIKSDTSANADQEQITKIIKDFFAANLYAGKWLDERPLSNIIKNMWEPFLAAALFNDKKLF